MDEEDAMSDADFDELVARWRGTFKKVTKEDIEKFIEEYMGAFFTLFSEVLVGFVSR